MGDPTIENSNILQHIKSGNRLPKPTYGSQILYKLMTQCWSHVPHYRPNFSYISHFINITLKDINQESVKGGGNSLAQTYVTVPLI